MKKYISIPWLARLAKRALSVPCIARLNHSHEQYADLAWSKLFGNAFAIFDLHARFAFGS